MLKIDCAKWGAEATQLREQAMKGAHPRTRERFMALYEITQGKNATQVALESGRDPHTVMDWAHKYNEHGAEALVYRKSGGRRPLFRRRCATTLQ